MSPKQSPDLNPCSLQHLETFSSLTQISSHAFTRVEGLRDDDSVTEIRTRTRQARTTMLRLVFMFEWQLQFPRMEYNKHPIYKLSTTLVQRQKTMGGGLNKSRRFDKTWTTWCLLIITWITIDTSAKSAGIVDDNGNYPLAAEQIIECKPYLNLRVYDNNIRCMVAMIEWKTVVTSGWWINQPENYFVFSKQTAVTKPLSLNAIAVAITLRSIRAALATRLLKNFLINSSRRFSLLSVLRFTKLLF